MTNILVGTVRLSRNNPNIIVSYIIYNSDDNKVLTLSRTNLINALKAGKKIQGIKLNDIDELETTITTIDNYLFVFLDRYEVYDTPIVIISEQSDSTYNVFGYLFKEKDKNKLLNNYSMYTVTLEELINYSETQRIVNGIISNNKVIPLKAYEPFQYIEVNYTETKGASTNIVLSEISPELKLTDNGDIYLSKENVTVSSSLETLYIPNGVKGVKARGFFRAPYKEVMISGTTCETIGIRAFSEMENLETIYLNNGLKNINGLAFKNCKKLKSIEIPASIEIISGTAFDGCDSLKEIILHNNFSLSDNGDFIASYNNKVKFID